jgi:hypothetical protein
MNFWRSMMKLRIGQEELEYGDESISWGIRMACQASMSLILSIVESQHW